MLRNIATQNTKAMVKWQSDLNLDLDENWGIHFNKLYYTTDDSKLLNFHFKLFHRIIYTNSRLFKCGLSETELCTFCSEQRETLLHLFYECSHVRTFLLQLRDSINSNCNIVLDLEPDKWILNQFTGTPTEIDCLSLCAIIAKHYIYCCKIKGNLPNITVFKKKLNSYRAKELYSKYRYSEKKAENIESRWLIIRPLFD